MGTSTFQHAEPREEIVLLKDEPEHFIADNRQPVIVETPDIRAVKQVLPRVGNPSIR
jgi:hypothetical protein